MLTDNHPIIFFDGICNFCNRSVLFIIRHDQKGWFRFASLQSPVACQYLGSNEGGNSIVLWSDHSIYRKSDAVLQIAKKLDSGWKFLYFAVVIPKIIRNFIYDIIAKNRYRWFGKREECMIPTPDLQSRFLE